MFALDPDFYIQYTHKCRLKQLAASSKTELRVCVVEKGSTLGAHSMSGACIEPEAIVELFPDYKERKAPLNQPVTKDRFYFLTENRAFRLPLPPSIKYFY